MPIKELSKSVSSKIAAGEVVERPASVVKELIENAIDAKATEIAVRVKGAGRILIEVEDNGEGISANDFRMAVKRYATSKISAIEDLDHIQTLGFRGEALASIAAVSRFSLESRYTTEKEGKKIIIEGGEMISNLRVGKNQGTKIQVSDLFFNVPARRKFLKKDITEKRQISELVTRYALYYSHIRFLLEQDGRKVLSTFGSADRREILSQIYDLETARRLLEVDYEDSMFRITGYTSPVNLTRSNRKEIIHFVNGRLISDSTLTSAIMRAYHGFLMTGRFPITILFIQTNPEEIDVNVHPTKAEIRFQDQGRVFSAVHTALKKIITLYSPVPSFSPDLWTNSSPKDNVVDPAWRFSEKEIDIENDKVPDPASQSKNAPVLDKVPLLRLIGQLGNMYIAAEGPDGLYLIDQHAAHERILFERMIHQDNNLPASQFLLEPAVIHLNPQLIDIFETQKTVLENIGFNFEEFGPNAIRVNALPVMVQHMSAENAILSTLEPDEEDNDFIGKELERKIISRICKRAAVKGGQVLSAQEQEKLIRDLENCESPRTCPHGRPTMIHLSVNLLARQFGRLGSR